MELTEDKIRKKIIMEAIVSLESAFVWSESIRGQKYWSSVKHNLNEELNK